MITKKDQKQVSEQLWKMRRQCTDNVIRLNELTTRILDDFPRYETPGMALIEIMEHMTNINLTVQKMWEKKAKSHVK